MEKDQDQGACFTITCDEHCTDHLVDCGDHLF